LIVPGTISEASCVLSETQLQGNVSATSNCPNAPIVSIAATGIPANGVFNVGDTPVTWTATDALGNSATTSEVVDVLNTADSFCPPQPARKFSLIATNSLKLDDNAEVVDVATGALAEVAGGAPGGTYLEVGAQVGALMSTGPVTLSNNAVTGAITTASTITRGVGDTTGTISAVNPNLPGLNLGETFPTTVGSLILQPGVSQTIAPQSLQSLTVNARATLTLLPGTYYFSNLDVESDAFLSLPGTAPVVIYVQSNLIFRGAIEGPVSAVALAQNTALGYFGTNAVMIQGVFDGTFLAPNASIDVASGTLFTGEIMAQSTEIQPGNVIEQVPFGP
jgi:hypothetical protein